jgi:hypothetical protein
VGLQRRVQFSAPLPSHWYCSTLNADGTPFCADSDFPLPSLITILFGCQEGGSERDCESCTILYEDGVDPDTFNLIDDPKCNSCEICPGGTTSSFAYNCANVPISGLRVMQSCDGTCSGTQQTEPPTPPATEPPLQCFPQSDGSCEYIDIGWSFNSFSTIYSGCSSSGGLLADICQYCSIHYSQDTEVNAVKNDPMCNQCAICPGGEIAWDCANLLTASDSCAIRDCNGACSSQPPLPNPWFCSISVGGTPYCVDDAFPLPNLHAILFGCQEKAAL